MMKTADLSAVQVTVTDILYKEAEQQRLAAEEDACSECYYASIQRES